MTINPWLAKLFPIVLATGCGANSHVSKGAPPPPFLIKIEYPVHNPDGPTEFRLPVEMLDERQHAVQVIRAASVRIVVQAEQRPWIQGNGLFPTEAVAGTVDEIRRLRDLDEGFYRIEQMVPGPDRNPTPTWTITFAPPSFVLLTRMLLFTMHNGQSIGLPFRLIFVPPDAPSNLVIQTDNISRRRVDWVDQGASSSGFEILESLSFEGPQELVGAVAATATMFESDDRLPDGSINAMVRNLWWQVCSRPTSPGALPHCSLPVSAPGRRVSPTPCSTGVLMVLTAVQSLDNPTLYRATTTNLAMVIAVTNPSAFPIEVRSRHPSYSSVPANGKVAMVRIAEGPWMVRVPSTVAPLPAVIPLTLEICP